MHRRRFLWCTGAAAFAGCARVQGSRTTGATKPEDFGHCGVDCRGCDVLKATLHGDEEARRRAHKLWEKTAQQHWGMKTLDPAILKCKGCRTEGGEVFRGSKLCRIRRCCRQRGLASCGLCHEWRDCERLRALFADEPRARQNLEKIAASTRG